VKALGVPDLSQMELACTSWRSSGERGGCLAMVPVELDDIQLKEQIARCRRLARELTDDEMRQSLEELAAEYEAKLKRRGGGFMLRRKSD
jgi:hypothetical protein